MNFKPRRPTLAMLLMPLLLAACASSTPLTRQAHLPSHQITLKDKRSAQDKQSKRGLPMLAALQYLADDRFSPTALELFQAELLKRLPPATPIAIELDEFRIVDHFAARAAGAATANGGPVAILLVPSLTESASKESELLNALKLSNSSDDLICFFVGRVNGRAVNVAAAERYQVSKWAGLVYNDADYQRALLVAIEKAAEAAATKILAEQK